MVIEPVQELYEIEQKKPETIHEIPHLRNLYNSPVLCRKIEWSPLLCIYKPFTFSWYIDIFFLETKREFRWFYTKRYFSIRLLTRTNVRESIRISTESMSLFDSDKQLKDLLNFVSYLPQKIYELNKVWRKLNFNYFLKISEYRRGSGVVFEFLSPLTSKRQRKSR